MKELVIVGIFYSGYKDLWLDFINLFNEYWKDCPYDKYIVSDTEDLEDFGGFRVINAGKNAEYSMKIQMCINLINSKRYLLLLEDFFIGNKIDTDKIKNILEFIEKNDISYYAIPMKDFSNNYKGKKITNIKDIRYLSPKADYTISCQPAIWERMFLSDCIGIDNYNAWVFEGIYRKSKKAHTDSFLKGCLANLSDPLHIKHGVLQGKFLPSVLKYYRKRGYLFSSNRICLNNKNYLSYKFKLFIRGILPYSLQKIVRKFTKKRSIRNKYDDQIDILIEKMKL